MTEEQQHMFEALTEEMGLTDEQAVYSMVDSGDLDEDDASEFMSEQVEKEAAQSEWFSIMDLAGDTILD